MDEDTLQRSPTIAQGNYLFSTTVVRLEGQSQRQWNTCTVVFLPFSLSLICLSVHSVLSLHLLLNDRGKIIKQKIHHHIHHEIQGI